MEFLPSKLLEQIAINTRPKKQEHIMIIMNTSIHEEHLFQSIQTHNKQFKIAVTFLSAYNGIFNVTNSIQMFYSKKSVTDADFIQITIPPGAYEIESLDNEIKRIIIDKGRYSESDYPFTIKPNFSTLGSVVIKKPRGAIIGFVFDDNNGTILRYDETIIWEEYSLSKNPVDKISFDNFFIETDIAQALLFRGKRSGIIHNFTMNVDPGYKYNEKFRGCIQWYMIDTKDFISSIKFKLKKEKNNLVSFNDQSVTFRLSIKEV